jgi:Sec-independent protein translocase protein TatA
MFKIGEILILLAIGYFFMSRRRLPEMLGMFKKSADEFKRGLAGEKEARVVKEVQRLEKKPKRDNT